MLMFFLRSLSFVAMFAAGVFYSILNSTIPLWIGCGIIFGMMVFDIACEVISCFVQDVSDSKEIARRCVTILHVIAFHALLLAIMLTATLTATYKSKGKTLHSNNCQKINVAIEGLDIDKT